MNDASTPAPYTTSQYLGIAAIVLFVFPIAFQAFAGLAVIPGFLIEAMVPDLPGALHNAVRGLSALLALGLGTLGSIWLCRRVWPRRADAVSA